MDIISLRNNIWGKTANGKTLCAFWFTFLFVEKPSSRAEGI